MACLFLCLAGCDDPARVAAVEPAACGVDGALVAEICGGVLASIDWDAPLLECEDTARPTGNGARLRFAGPADTADGKLRPAFKLGLPDLRRGATARKLPTNVTLMEEGAGRFFGTRDAVSRWTDIERHEPLQPAASATYTISGILYCVAPLADLNGNASISFADLKFTGRLDWQPAR